LAKRRKPATSATTVTATTRATPRIACSAVTTGAIIQLGSNSLDSPRQPVEPGFGVLRRPEYNPAARSAAPDGHSALWSASGKP